MDLSKYQRPTKQQTLIRSERDEQLQKFLDRLNPDRIKAGFKPLTAKRLLGQITKAGFKTGASDLYILYQRCASGDSFGKLFNHLTRPK